MDKQRADIVGENTPLSLSEKAFRYLVNAIEHTLSAENFIVSNLTPYDIIHRDGIMSVRHYLPLGEDEILIGTDTVTVNRDRKRVPLVLVPPLAATAMVFDLLPQRSVVRFFLAKGFDVYLIDWGDVTGEQKDISLETYVLEWMPRAFDKVRQDSDEKELSIFSYCMGGLLTLMYAAAERDPYVRNIVTVASPVDMHQMGVAGRMLAMTYRPAQIISRLLNFSLMDLPSRYLHIPGWVNSTVFKLTNPMGSVISYWELLVNMWDREYVKNHQTMKQWFNDMVDYPGETIKGMAVRMAINNQMAKGRMKMGDAHAEFERIHCAILAFAGDSDKLVPVRAARKILDIVSSEDKEFCVVPGGHAGVFAGSKAPSHTWAISADWLTDRSD
ncbi:MAG: alpha/beta hydrolase [Gammaproteobacteria bacterium]|nr:MAG: alpha/beta hydrolase [Gammaproteobacteria bacterium]